SGFYHDRALHSFSLKFASDIIIPFNVILKMPCIGCASSAAVKSGEALPAVFFCINVAVLKFVLDLGMRNTVIHISHEELLFSHKLMAGIKIPPRRHREIFHSGSASGKPLVHAGSSGKIDHEMEEIKSLSFLLSFDHLFCQNIVFLQDLGNVLSPDGIFLRIGSHYRLYGNLLESQIRKMEYIFREVKVMVGKSTSHIIILLIP